MRSSEEAHLFRRYAASKGLSLEYRRLQDLHVVG